MKRDIQIFMIMLWVLATALFALAVAAVVISLDKFRMREGAVIGLMAAMAFLFFVRHVDRKRSYRWVSVAFVLNIMFAFAVIVLMTSGTCCPVCPFNPGEYGSTIFMATLILFNAMAINATKHGKNIELLTREDKNRYALTRGACIAGIIIVAKIFQWGNPLPYPGILL